MGNLNASQLVSRFPLCFVIRSLNLAALYCFGHFLGDKFLDSVMKSGAAAASSPGPLHTALYNRHHNCCCESREQQSFYFTNDPASPWLAYHVFSASFLTLIISFVSSSPVLHRTFMSLCHFPNFKVSHFICCHCEVKFNCLSLEL